MKREFALVSLVGFLSAVLGVFVGRGSLEFGEKVYAKAEKTVSHDSLTVSRKKTSSAKVYPRQTTDSETKTDNRFVPIQNELGKPITEGKGKSPGNIILDPGAGKVIIEADNADASSVTQLLRLSHTTSGTPAAGIGAGLEFEAEDEVDSTVAGSIKGILTDVTNGAEEGALLFYTADMGDDGLAERMRIDKDGNVGIGTTSPMSDLEIYDGNGAAVIRGIGSGSAYDFATLQLSSDEVTDKTWQISHRNESATINDLWFMYHDGTNWTTKMAVKTSGNVGIGTA